MSASSRSVARRRSSACRAATQQARTRERMEWRRDTEGSPVPRLELPQLPRGTLTERGASLSVRQPRQFHLEKVAAAQLSIDVDQAVRHGHLEAPFDAEPAHGEILLLGGGDISQVALEQVRQAEPRVHVLRCDPNVVPEVVRRLAVLPLGYEQVLIGVAGRRW